MLAKELEKWRKLLFGAKGVHKDDHLGIFGLIEGRLHIEAKGLDLEVQELGLHARKSEHLHHFRADIGRQQHAAGDVIDLDEVVEELDSAIGCK